MVPDKTDVGRTGKKPGGIFRVAGRQEYFEIPDTIYDLIEIVDVRSCSLVFGIEYPAVNKDP